MDRKIRIFDTKVQHLRYKVIREVARHAWSGDLTKKVLDIPNIIIPGPFPEMRCCVYKERAIVSERVKLALGGNDDDKNVIQVIKVACDECPTGGYEVTNACRGCLANRCEDVCKVGAISFDHNYVAHIDKSKCIECGACAKVCPFTAIVNRKRPCQNACKVKAITMDEHKAAHIDDDKCISCGACVYQCPFGAISDKSYVTKVIDLIKQSNDNTNYKMYAIVAPAISSQFTYAKLGQIISGIKQLGFSKVLEAALGADIVAMDEAKELVEKKFLTSSCCPAFVSYIKKAFPSLVDHISHNPSPMVALAKYIKEKDPSGKIIFIGPCTAKKMEISEDEVSKYVDSVITFEELQALFDSKSLDINSLEEEKLDDASYYGRIFARSGGLTEAVTEALKEQGMGEFELKPITCDGVEECRIALLKKNKNLLDANFIEGMVCLGGCIGGAGCLTHGDKNKTTVDQYGKTATNKTIQDSINNL